MALNKSNSACMFSKINRKNNKVLWLYINIFIHTHTEVYPNHSNWGELPPYTTLNSGLLTEPLFLKTTWVQSELVTQKLYWRVKRSYTVCEHMDPFRKQQAASPTWSGCCLWLDERGKGHKSQVRNLKASNMR